MNKTIIALMVAGFSLVGGISSTYAASGTSGNITVSGLITESNCDVDFSKAENVSMPEIDSKTLSGRVGRVSEMVNATIILNGCPSSVTAASLTVSGEKDINNSDLLANATAAGSATGVGIEFLAAADPLPVGQATPDAPLVDGNTEIPLNIRYRSVLDHVTGGKVSATGQLNIQYK